MKRITKNIYQVLNESISTDIPEEILQYLYEEVDFNINGNKVTGEISFPSYDEFNNSVADISKNDFNKACETIKEAIEKAEFYYDDNSLYIQLSDNQTVYELTNEEKPVEEWYSIVNSKEVEFENETDTKLYFLGRSARHVCVDNNVHNLLNYDSLCEIQERLEKEAVEEFNSTEMNEGYDIDSTDSNIVSDNVMHADTDPRFQTKEQVDDELLAAKLADFSLDTTDEENWNEYTDEEYYDKNKKDYLSQINDVNFIKGVVSLLQDRVNNEGPSADGYDRDVELLDLFKHKLESLKLGEALDVNRKRNKGLEKSIKRIKSEIESIDKENESCTDEEKSKRLIDKRDDLVKRLEQLEKITESSTNKDYELIEAKEEDLDKLYDDSAFTFEGFMVDDENLTKLVNFLKENTEVILPIKIYRISGEMMNSKYGLTEDNAYPDDLNIVSLPLDNWKNLGNLPSYKIQIGARWFDDIVDNNRMRQEEINMPEKNIYRQENMNESIDENTEVIRSKIEFDGEEPYFEKDGSKYYLNDYIFDRNNSIITLDDGMYKVDIEYGIEDYIILNKVSE